MVHARTKEDNHLEEDGRTWVDGPGDGRVQFGLAQGADQSKHQAEEVELANFAIHKRQQSPQLDDRSMEACIGPTADGIVGRVLPRLQSIAVIEVVRRLPVIEDFITVLNWRADSSSHIGCQKKVKCRPRWHLGWRAN